MPKPVICSWSGGKDSALALHAIGSDPDLEVAVLLTTLNEETDRVSMQGVRRELLRQQAEMLGYPLLEVDLPPSCSNAVYEEQMAAAIHPYKERGVRTVVFGDLFLEDIRAYREQKLTRAGMAALFPLWECRTSQLADRFIRLGFKAVVTCIDSSVLNETFVGSEYDRSFLSRLPDSVDPCGENGEFHTFVYDGPLFQRAVPVKRGTTSFRKQQFCYCDFVPDRSRQK